MLAAALRLSITGCWNMIARRVGDDTFRPPQVMRPRDTGRSPIATRRRVVLPEPLGPISTVGAPAEKVSEISSRTATPLLTIPTSEKQIGKSESSVRTLILRSALRRDARPMPVR
jgi:hypothetical protein